MSVSYHARAARFLLHVRTPSALFVLALAGPAEAHGEEIVAYLLGAFVLAGFAVGSLFVLTMPTAARWRLAGLAGVLVAAVIGGALGWSGAVGTGLAFLFVPLLVPSLSSLFIRGFLQSRYSEARPGRT